MEHKIIPAMWKSREGLATLIEGAEQEGWSVGALGEVFGNVLLVMVNDGQTYQHEMISVLLKDRIKVKSIIAQKEIEGWQVCAIGEVFGSNIMILKRQM